MIYEKLRVENVQLNCLFTRLNRQEIINRQKKPHKSIATGPPLTSDAMSSDNSEDKRNNTTVKSGGHGYLSKEDYQSRRKSSQGIQDHSRRDERQDKGCTEKRMQELEDKKSTKGDIWNASDWTGEEANLADKVMEFCKDFLFPCYKFFKDGWRSYKPENDKSFCYFLGKNMANSYRNMRIATMGSTFEDEWDRIYIPTIGLKYTHC